LCDLSIEPLGHLSQPFIFILCALSCDWSSAPHIWSTHYQVRLCNEFLLWFERTYHVAPSTASMASISMVLTEVRFFSAHTLMPNGQTNRRATHHAKIANMFVKIIEAFLSHAHKARFVRVENRQLF
jgi:hypothetical protein